MAIMVPLPVADDAVTSVAADVVTVGATVGAVLNELVKRNPPLEGVIHENGKHRPHAVITLNGQNVIDINMRVEEDDLIAIFPPIAGG